MTKSRGQALKAIKQIVGKLTQEQMIEIENALIGFACNIEDEVTQILATEVYGEDEDWMANDDDDDQGGSGCLGGLG